MSDEIESIVFSHPINVRKLSRKGQNIRFAASIDVRERIAVAHDLIGVDSFEVECLIMPWKRDGATMTGTVTARVSQPCAATGEPLRQRVVEELDARFLPQSSRYSRPPSSDEHELVLDPMGEDLPDRFDGDSIDLAASWLEFFALGLDPFARINGAEFDTDGLDTIRESPFSVLAKLKSESKNN